MISILKNIQLFSFIIIIPSLIFVGFFPDFFLSLTSLLFIIISVIEKDFRLYRSKIFIFLMIWNIYLIFLSLFSQNIILSLESSLFYFRFAIFVIATQYILVNNKNVFKYLLISIQLSFLFLIIDSFIQYFYGKNILGYPYLGDRISSFFKDELILGSYLSRLVPLLFALTIIVYRKKLIPYLLCLSTLVFIDVLVFLSGERTAFFNLLLFTIILIILSNNFKILRIITLIFSISILSFITINNLEIKQRMIDKTINQTNISNLDIFTDNQNDNLQTQDQKDNYDIVRFFSSEHQLLFFTAIEIFKDNPIIGIGPKLYRHYCKDDIYYKEIHRKDTGKMNNCSTHPHNTYLQLLSETGLIGALPVIVIFFYIIYKFLNHLIFKIFTKKQKLSDLEIMLLSGFLITLWPFYPTGNFFNNWLSIIYYFPIGIYLHLKTKEFNK